MWENIWKKDQILYLIERFIYIKKKEERNPDTKKIKRSKSLIFPRFHQLRAVQKIMENIKKNHTSRNYLIEHSAGSGKTETISWLAHILATLHDDQNRNIVDTVLTIKVGKSKLWMMRPTRLTWLKLSKVIPRSS
jgi:type I restriction enzyme R subunit